MATDFAMIESTKLNNEMNADKIAYDAEMDDT